MDLQKIEPLLMDHALGATTPEVGALIEAFQEKDTAVRAQLEMWRGVAKKARQAMEESATTVLPAFPQRQLQTARRRSQRRRLLAWGTGLAACLLIGYLLGSRGHDAATRVVVTERQRPTDPLPVLTAAGEVPSAGVKEFWSVSRLRAAAAQDDWQPVRSSANEWGNRWNLLQYPGG